MNGDFIVDGGDADAINKVIQFQNYHITPEEWASADVDHNGHIDNFDILIEYIVALLYNNYGVKYCILFINVLGKAKLCN